MKYFKKKIFTILTLLMLLCCTTTNNIEDYSVTTFSEDNEVSEIGPFTQF